ncbi:protein translocase subunit SecD [Occallatibacter savannae]|uniref:protein translocase subunit SecD n=1 Tax=Occallatibacter savannae TaxID=1002691 RepID=UPI000D686875|nr:protein translocase subunit SecD [Occallatibacter savannae]
MKKNLKQKVVIIFGVLIVFLYGAFFGFDAPNLGGSDPLLKKLTRHIHLGLDLQGGVHLILQVQVKEAVNTETDNTLARIEQDLKAAKVSFSQVLKPDPTKPELIRIEGVNPTQSGAAREVLDSKYSNEYDVAGGGADGAFTVTMKPNIEKALDDRTVQNTIEVIRDRVDTLGVAEPVIQQYGLGDNQILVELPGISDIDRVRTIITSTARLEIHAVEGGPYPDEQAALASVSGSLPPDQELVHGSASMGNGSDADSVYILKRVAIVAGTDFRSADPGTDQNTGQRTVHFTLTNEAGDKFWEYTSANVGHSMAVVLGGRVKEVANIESAIRDSGEIRGSFSQDEVTILSKMLRTGALPASINYLEDRTVGPSLGADSIRNGITAAVVGVLLVMVFMLVYYKGSGINADLALFLNLVILLGFMGFSGATLTLPGIAGVILTIGMGVDSNVLIFERIREEMRAGKAPSAAVDQGFAHAWTTILDTHVTTIVSAAILFLFGSGPVKGFAVTLTFGLAANLFTAVYVSRVIFDTHVNNLKAGEAVSI